MSALERLKETASSPLGKEYKNAVVAYDDLALVLAVADAVIPLSRKYGDEGSTGQWEHLGNAVKALTT